MNGAVSKVNKKFISHLTRVKHTPLAAASVQICDYSARCTVITDLDTSERSTQKAFSCCNAILETGPHGPAVSMRSELLVAHEKLGQLPLLTVYVLPV